MDLDCTRTYLLDRDFRRGGALTLDPVDPALPAEELARGDLMPTEPVVLRVQGRRLLGDFAPTSFVGMYAVSRSAQGVLRDGGFTGWSTFPIRIEGLMAEEFDGYQGLAVTGRSGEIDDSLSRRVVRPGPAGRPAPHRLGLCPRPGSWDGSDLFVPAGTYAICVTEPVRDAFVRTGVVGIVMKRLTERAEWIWDE